MHLLMFRLLQPEGQLQTIHQMMRNRIVVEGGVSVHGVAGGGVP